MRPRPTFWSEVPILRVVLGKEIGYPARQEGEGDQDGSGTGGVVVGVVGGEVATAAFSRAVKRREERLVGRLLICLRKRNWLHCAVPVDLECHGHVIPSWVSEGDEPIPGVMTSVSVDHRVYDELLMPLLAVTVVRDVGLSVVGVGGSYRFLYRRARHRDLWPRSGPHDSGNGGSDY